VEELGPAKVGLILMCCMCFEVELEFVNEKKSVLADKIFQGKNRIGPISSEQV
jgi:hypothetical protein